MESRWLLRALAVPCLVAVAACDVTEPDVERAVAADAAVSVVDFPAPAPLVTVSARGSSLAFWPFTASTLGGPATDPMNVLFPGIDARSIRAALLMVDGNRSAFGPLAAFDCTWKEAMGANQAAYATASGWEGSAIQLECGDYGPVRFHLRMFPAGSWTTANAHFEVQVAGTNEHEVLSWEVAEALVTADLVRSGALGAPPAPSDVITPVPTYRDINPLVYNGLPDGLWQLTGGPAPPTPTPVPIGNDGRATILTLASPIEGERTVVRRSFVLDFDQTIPKPFCIQSPLDWLIVKGPIDFDQQVVVSGSGNFVSRFHAKGRLELIPVNVLTRETDESLEARVMEQDHNVVTDRVTLVSTLQMQVIFGNGPDSGRLMATLNVGPGASDHAGLEITCGS